MGESTNGQPSPRTAQGMPQTSQQDSVAALEASLRAAEARCQELESALSRLEKRHTERELDHQRLRGLNDRLAEANAASAELMAELEEKNEVLARVNKRLAQANAHAADLMAIVELRGEEIQALNKALAGANVRAAELLAELEINRDKLVARNEELDAFSHSVAHDLRNPLGHVLGYAELVLENHSTMSEDLLHQSLEAVVQGALRMGSIIDALLLLAQVRSEDVQVEPLDVASIVSQAQERLAPVAQGYGAEIILAERWPTVAGYGPWVEEVWVNYLSNALKYGGRPPCIELDAKPQEDSMVRCQVRDNGRGLTQEEQARLFTPFTRLHQVDTKGYGLGLSIVRRIVEKLNGRVGVESTVGEGSVFYFDLPAWAEV